MTGSTADGEIFSVSFDQCGRKFSKFDLEGCGQTRFRKGEERVNGRRRIGIQRPMILRG